eukprot:COSAG02_NODE_10524_length_1922_cov_3.500247_1_plen_73_part_00
MINGPSSALYFTTSSLLSFFAAQHLNNLDDATCSGHGWQGCGQPLADEGGGYPFPEEYNTDFGTPKGICSVR